MTRPTTKLPAVLMTAVALAFAATGAAQARDPYPGRIPHKVRADATGYFFYPANYMDDMYVYVPPAERRIVRHKRHVVRALD